jgi:hypothetical protein
MFVLMKNKDPRSEPTSFTLGGSRLKLTQLTMSPSLAFEKRERRACYLSSKSSSDFPEQLDEDRVHATPVPKGAGLSTKNT